MIEASKPIQLDNFDIDNDEWDQLTKHLSPKIRNALDEVKLQFDQKLIQKKGANYASDFVRATMPKANHKEWTEKLLFQIRQQHHEKKLVRSFSDYIRSRGRITH